MDRKAVAGIILTLILSGMSTLVFGIQPVKAEPRTWTVDDDGPADFSSIQEAINSPQVMDGDTIYVYNGIYYEHLVVNKALTLVGQNRNSSIIDGMKMGIVVKITTNNVNISDFTIRNSGPYWAESWPTPDSGISLFKFNGSLIRNNIIENNTGGLFLRDSFNNTIEGNTLLNNRNGISLFYSSNNTLRENVIISNKGYGVFLYYSDNNTVSENTLTNIFFMSIELQFCINNVLLRNIIEESYGGVELYGWEWKSSRDNAIIGNTITNNSLGISLSSYASDNTIYHNNFIDNDRQVYSSGLTNTWDDGYPSGGNYWSDYEERYPNAKELDYSGIWDTPYVIDENNQDNYPLMEPWTPLPRTIDELKTEIEEWGSEGEIDNPGIVKSLIAKLNVAQKLVDKGKINEAKSILEDDFIPQVQNLSGIHITVEAADILIKSAEYLISQL